MKMREEMLDIMIALSEGCHTAEMAVIMCLTTRMKILQISNYDHQTKPKERRTCEHCPRMADCLQAIFDPARLEGLEDEPYSLLSYAFVFGK